MQLILLRHGNTFEAHETPYQVGKQTDLALTEKGIEQAKQFVHCLQSQQITPYALYCGSLKRQLYTQTIIQNAFPESLNFTHELSLDEIDYGKWEGLTLDQIQTLWPMEYKDWHEQATWPEGIFKQSIAEHIALLKSWLVRITLETPEDATVVAISSNGIIRLLLQFLPELWKSIREQRKMAEYKVGTGHFCELLIKQNEILLQRWNQKP